MYTHSKGYFAYGKLHFLAYYKDYLRLLSTSVKIPQKFPMLNWSLR